MLEQTPRPFQATACRQAAVLRVSTRQIQCKQALQLTLSDEDVRSRPHHVHDPQDVRIFSLRWDLQDALRARRVYGKLQQGGRPSRAALDVMCFLAGLAANDALAGTACGALDSTMQAPKALVGSGGKLVWQVWLAGSLVLSVLDYSPSFQAWCFLVLLTGVIISGSCRVPARPTNLAHRSASTSHQSDRIRNGPVDIVSPRHFHTVPTLVVPCREDAS